MNLKKLLVLFFALITAACNLAPLKIDPCGIMPDLKSCYAVPINQPDKPEYERSLQFGDICVTAEEYSELQKHYREVLRRCGDRCK